MLRDEIIFVLNEHITFRKQWVDEIADSILALPEMVALAEKAVKWDALGDIISLGSAWRAAGWLHRDDPIEGLVVEEKCGSGKVWKHDGCELCHGTGTITRQLTVGECPEILGNLLLTKAVLAYHAMEPLPEITLPSGGRVRVQK